MAIAAVAAVIGHMFPIWLKFHGGKGVATGLGVFIPICWQAVAAGIVLWLLVVIFWRYSSLGSIIAAAVMPVFVYFLYAPGHAPPDIVNVSTALVAVLIIIKHRSNIQRLIAGEETKLKLGR
jgi:glycerol-3-phosphate acyltransferase PlsY